MWRLLASITFILSAAEAGCKTTARNPTAFKISAGDVTTLQLNRGCDVPKYEEAIVQATDFDSYTGVSTFRIKVGNNGDKSSETSCFRKTNFEAIGLKVYCTNSYWDCELQADMSASCPAPTYPCCSGTAICPSGGDAIFGGSGCRCSKRQTCASPTRQPTRRPPTRYPTRRPPTREPTPKSTPEPTRRPSSDSGSGSGSGSDSGTQASGGASNRPAASFVLVAAGSASVLYILYI